MNNAHMIVTHAGSFHADEVVALVLLERFYFIKPLVMTIDEDINTVRSWMSGAKKTLPRLFFADGTEDARSAVPIVRTRDAGLLNDVTKNPDVFVVDVGGAEDAALLNFDHHQKTMVKTWDDGTPLSSTGLVWNFLKNKGLLDLPLAVLTEVEDRLIKPLDLHDNGEGVCPVAGVMAGYNRSSSDPKEQDRQFWRALSMMREVFNNTVFAAELKIEAETVLRDEWSKASARNETVVVLPRPIAYHDCTGLLKEISQGKADMIAIPGQGKRFSLVSMKMEEAFSIKHPVPKDWRGRSNFEAETEKGPLNILFAHKSGFMCVVEGKPSYARLVMKHVVAEHMKVKNENTQSGRSPRV